jgi:hypothetical protein
MGEVNVSDFEADRWAWGWRGSPVIGGDDDDGDCRLGVVVVVAFENDDDYDDDADDYLVMAMIRFFLVVMMTTEDHFTSVHRVTYKRLGLLLPPSKDLCGGRVRRAKEWHYPRQLNVKPQLSTNMTTLLTQVTAQMERMTHAGTTIPARAWAKIWAELATT